MEGHLGDAVMGNIDVPGSGIMKRCWTQRRQHLAALHQGQATSASYGLWLGCAHLALAGCQQAAATSSWAACETSVTQLCNSLPLFSRVNTAMHWAPLLLPQEPRSGAEGYQEKADTSCGFTPFIECKQKANNWNTEEL